MATQRELNNAEVRQHKWHYEYVLAVDWLLCRPVQRLKGARRHPVRPDPVGQVEHGGHDLGLAKLR